MTLHPNKWCGRKSLQITHPLTIPPTLHVHPLMATIPPPGIQGAIAMQNWLITSTLFCFAVAHCFNVDYLDRFCPGVDDVTICPCANNPSIGLEPRVYRHMQQHVIFRCTNHSATWMKFIHEFSTLKQILQSKEFTIHLGNFLIETNSTLLCLLPKPLPVLWPGHDLPL